MAGCDSTRRELDRVLSDPAVSVLVVEHRDRLACFGARHLQAALAASGPRLVASDPEETTSDLVGDITDVAAWVCARLSGQRATKNPGCLRYRCGRG
jgi:putative resolvase